MLASAARQAARRSLAPTTRRAFSDAAAPSIKRDITRDTSRHLRSDGRVSLKKHLVGERAEGGAVSIFKSNMNAATWPLVLIIGGGIGIACFQMGRHATVSPEVQWNKADRSNPMHHTEEAGKNWVAHKPSDGKGDGRYVIRN